MSKQWYVVRVQTGREDKIRDSLEKRVKASGMEELFGELMVPTEKVSQIRGGKKMVRKKKIYPGYLMLELEADDKGMNDDAWFLVRETPGIGDFIGAEQKPVPMEPHEVERLLGLTQTKDEEPKVQINFNVGDQVKVKEGPFQNFDGTVEEIVPQKGLVKVNVTIFGRTTPVELEYWQVESI